MMAESARGASGGRSQSGSYGGEGMDDENYSGRGSRYSNGVLGGDGLPQFVAQGDREDSPPLIIQM